MATIREITIDWTCVGTPATKSVLYFESLSTPDIQRSAIYDALFQSRGLFSNSTQFSLPLDGREIDDATGTLVGFWNASTAFASGGTAVDEPVPNASQGLLRFRTPEVVDGRLLQGRMFVPGLAQSATVDGGLTAAAVGTLGGFWASSVIDGLENSQVVWHRPIRTPGGGAPARVGSSTFVTDVSVWNELAVLRRRR